MSDSEPTPKLIGEIIDNLGVKIRMKEGDLISDVLIVTKVVEADGTVRMSSAWSESGDWITRLGLITAASHIELPTQDQWE